MKIIDNLRDGYEILRENNISSYKIDCEILMSQTLSISREEVILNLATNIKKEESDIKKRIKILIFQVTSKEMN